MVQLAGAGGGGGGTLATADACRHRVRRVDRKLQSQCVTRLLLFLLLIYWSIISRCRSTCEKRRNNVPVNDNHGVGVLWGEEMERVGGRGEMNKMKQPAGGEIGK